MKYLLNLILILCFNFLAINTLCDNYDDDYFCPDDDTRFFSEEDDNYAFQTPPRNDIFGRYKSTYQDMRYLVGYAQQKYSADKSSCTLKFITKVNPILGEAGVDYNIKYTFGDITQDNNYIELNSVDHSFPNGMAISAQIINNNNQKDMVKLELEDEYFMWDNPVINLPDEYENGQRGSIVELFGWPYEDIELECEFLSNAGYLGVKIFSPNEQLLTSELNEGGNLNPWWYGTQVVSYRFESRYGNKKQLKKMINACRKVNVRVYAESVINHLTGGGNDMYDDHISSNCDHWGPKSGSGGSPFWTIIGRAENNPITNHKPVIEYPAIPYFPSHIHCALNMDDQDDYDQLTNGWSFSMADVNTEKEYVRQRIADYYTELLSIGISGIYIPNALYIPQDSFVAIFVKLKENLGGVIPDDFIAVFLPENYDIEMYLCDDSLLNIGVPFTEKFQEAGFSDSDINKIKFWFKGFHGDSSSFLPICEDEWQIDVQRQVISLEFSDDINQGNSYFTYIRDKTLEDHRAFTISLFTDERYSYDWKIRNIFSTFSLYGNTNGIPDGKSECSYCTTENCRTGCSTVPYRRAYNPFSTGYDTGTEGNWIEGEYTRVHRDQQIINAMRKWMFPEKLEMTDNELYNKERLKTNCNEKCLICNEESKKDDLCIICNNTKGYYPVIYPGTEQKFYECYKSTEQKDRLFFDENEHSFKPCYESCLKCNQKGDSENHYCLACDSNLVQKPITSETTSNTNTFNCVTNCSNSYYFTASGQYKCTDVAYCPTYASLYIPEKKKCIDSCQNDADYKYLYNGNCVEECPSNTIKDEDNFICKENANENECTLSAKEITLDNFYDDNIIKSIVKSYKNEYSYTNRHILKLINSGYNIYIYKDFDCINLLSLGIETIDPESCVNKVKSENSIDEKLIIVYFEKIKIKICGYLIYNPINGQRLNFPDICIDEDISTVANDFTYINIKLQNSDNDEIEECPTGFYPIAYPGKVISYEDCRDPNVKYDNIYFNNQENFFLPCYDLCKRCNKDGDIINNNCISCEDGYIRHPLMTGSEFNCVQKCLYSYYFTQSGIYKCATTPQCPFDYNKLIKERNQCIDDCKKDDTYKFLYNGICLLSCPEGTRANPDEGDYLCKVTNTNECTLSKKEVELKNFNADGGLDSLVKSYNDEFFYTNKHISEFNNAEFNITIYKETNCISELGLKFPTINFGNCYNKVKEEYKIQDQLIIVLVEKSNSKGSSSSSYSFYHPLTSDKLDAEKICKDEEIIVEENILDILDDYDIDYESIVFLTGQNIDIFNQSGAFYTDLCYPFESPINRDITLEDRLKAFFPNISLCDEGCKSQGINLTTMKAICNCKFNDISNNEIIGNMEDIGLGEVMELISSSNIEVLKCFKFLFKKFRTSIGGYLILFSLAICIGFGLYFYMKDLNKIKKYIINKTTYYLNYLSDISTNNEIKNIEKIEKDLSKNKLLIYEKNSNVNKHRNKNRENSKNDYSDVKQDSIEQGKELFSLNKNNNSKEVLSSYTIKNSKSINQLFDPQKSKEKSEKEKENDKEIYTEEKEDFKKYLEPDIDEQQFEDICLTDKRTFKEYFIDSLKEKQIFINTFYDEDPFRPFSIKIVLLVLNLIMYMTVNGFFYGEEAISEIYHIEGDDPFFGFFMRSLSRFVYSAVVGVVIGLIIDFFFIEEKTMKKIFLRQKENIVILKFEITKLNKKIKIRYLSFIIFVIIILILLGFYLLCFNYVYPHTQFEWIKSSICLIIIMQILSVLTALLETLLRFAGLRFKSEKIFKLSKLLD